MKKEVKDALGFGAMVWAVIYGLGCILCGLGSAIVPLGILWIVISNWLGL